MRGTFVFIIFMIAPAFAELHGSNSLEQNQVKSISDAIRRIHPRLSVAKRSEFSAAIYHASVRFQIDPQVLVSIAQQESSFRENLPEGAAGELGLCQVRKSWLSYEGFKKVFPGAKRGDLLKADKNFLFAAWILSTLKGHVKEDEKLPYWSFYNARKFKNRFRYFLSVNRYLEQVSIEARPISSSISARYKGSVTRVASWERWISKRLWN